MSSKASRPPNTQSMIQHPSEAPSSTMLAMSRHAASFCQNNNAEASQASIASRPGTGKHAVISGMRQSTADQLSKRQSSFLNETEEDDEDYLRKSQATNASGQGNQTKRTTGNNLSHQDDELIEELARTCFKSGGFYKPDKDSSLPSVEEVEREERRRLGAAMPKMSSEPAALVTPEMANRRVHNELIKIDESQFVTLSQVQDNRVQTSSGRSPTNSVLTPHH